MSRDPELDLELSDFPTQPFPLGLKLCYHGILDFKLNLYYVLQPSLTVLSLGSLGLLDNLSRFKLSLQITDPILLHLPVHIILFLENLKLFLKCPFPDPSGLY